MIGSCPDDERLIALVMDPADLAHVVRCGACQVKQALLGAYRDDPVPLPEGVSEGLPSDLAARIGRDLAAGSSSTSAAGGRIAIESRRWIGTSERGPTWLVFDRQRERQVVLRRLYDVDPERVLRVKGVVEALRHSTLVGWLDVFVGEALEVTREHVEAEDLETAFDNAPRARLLRWCGLLASALSALHDGGVAHGGLSPSNVRIAPGGNLKVLDIGLGGLPPRSPWRAPELGPGAATPAGDWYALGRLVERYAPQLLLGDLTSPCSLATVLRSLVAPGPDDRPRGASVLAALLREQGLGGVDATRYQQRGLPIDEGGQGEILRVYDPVLRRDVALKRMIDRSRANLDGMRRFLNEAVIAARLQHPSILPVHELDHLPDGSPFFTMKLIEGRKLETEIEAAHATPTAPLRPLVEWYARLCEAVAYAHSQGVAHLDLKPSNVLVGAFGEVQLIDWGAAWDVANKDGPIVCTPGYRSPEQKSGERERIDRTSDVYSLGALFHHLLTGHAPPKGDLEHQLEPVLVLNRAAPPELAAVVERCVQPRPEDRYPNAAALGEDVHAWLRGDEVRSYRYSWVERLERRTRGQRGYWALGLLSLLAVSVVGGFALTSWRESVASQRRELERQGLVLAEQARLALVAGNRVEAERLAVRSVAVSDGPMGRGLLLQLGRRPYPHLAGECIAEGAALTCSAPPAVITWSGGAEAPRPAGERAAPAPPLEVPGRSGLGWVPCGQFAAGLLPGGRIGVYHADGVPLLEREGTSAPACDASGRLLAFAVDDTLRVWRTTPLEEVAILGGHDGAVVAAAWSADGGRLVSADASGTVRSWDPTDWTEQARLPDHGAIRALAFVPGEPLLLVAAEVPRVWHLDPGGASGHIETRVPLRRVWWGGGGLATLDRHGTWRFWDPADGRFLKQVRRYGDDLAPELAPTGDAAVSVTPAGDVRVAELLGGLARDRWVVPAGARVAAWFGIDRVVAGGADGVVRLLDAADGARTESWGRGAPITSVALAGEAIWVVREGGAAERVARDGSEHEVTDVAKLVAHPSGLLAVAHAAGEVVAGTPEDLRAVSSGDPVLALALSPDARVLAVARADQTVRLHARVGEEWLERARVVHDLRSSASLAFSPSGDALAVVGAGSAVDLWDLSALGKPAADLERSVATRLGVPP